MKKFGKAMLMAVFAVVLILGVGIFAACSGSKSSEKSKSEYSFIFMSGTVVLYTVTAKEGSEYKSQMGAEPTRTGYVFEGWSLTPNGDVEQLPDKMPAQNRTYYAVFSARYNLTFTAGIGTIPDDKKVMSVKEGEPLYALVSAVTPAVSDGDAVFDAWYLRGTERITATSGQTMPKGNVEVVAKYSVGYTINIYKEKNFKQGNYPTAADETVTSTAHVGDRISDLPSYNGFYYDDNKENAVLRASLNKNSAQNKFDLYYKILGYDAVFNANLPSDVDYTGTMETMTCGYGEDNIAPDCGFTADGYRFDGWSTDPNGDVEFRAGETFSVERATTIYAHWVKGLTEVSGFSSDRVYIMDKPQAGGALRKVAYLERTGLDDILGEYNATTHVFTFKNVFIEDSDVVLLRGIADSAAGTFAYLNTSNAVQYSLMKLDGTVDSSAKLKLNDDGSAVYNDGTDNYNGKYTAGADGSLVFSVDGKEKFAFRIVQSDGGLTCFMIRGEEYGTWNNITQDGYVDTTYTLYLDGYGYALMQVFGLNSSLTNVVMGMFDGLYIYGAGDGAYTGDEGTEVVVALYNSSLYMRQFACLLMEGEYETRSENDTDVYTHVFLERFETTLYAAPQDETEFDKETADKIELSGYSVLDNSATYTYNKDGSTVTVKGKYEYDRTAGTLRIIPSSGDELLFEVNVLTIDGESEEETVVVFEPVNELFGQYFVNGLDSTFGPRGYYAMYIYNNGVAMFAFRVPVSDAFYGNILFEYTRMVYGEYTVAVEGEDDKGQPDPRANVYEFSAEIDPATSYYLYYLYGSLYGMPISINGFGSFRFQFVYSATTGEISYVTVTRRGDFQAGEKFTYNEVEYTLDGFGTATAADGSKMSYDYDTSIRIGRLFITPDASKPDDTVLYVDAFGDGNFVEYEFNYVTANAGTRINMIFFKDDTALLTLNYSSGLSVSYYSFSFGNVQWHTEIGDATHKYGRYTRDESVDFSDVYYPLNITYSSFEFVIITTTEKNKNGEDVEVVRLYLYDIGSAEGESVTVNSNGDELTINRKTVTATYVKKGVNGGNDTTYTGSFAYADDRLYLIYKVDEDNTAQIVFKLEYGPQGEISSFRVIRSEAGYYVDADDSISYLYLSGESTDEAGVYSGTYYEYNPEYEEEGAEVEKFIEHEGTYKVTAQPNTIGYDFTYATGEKDDEDNDVTETFTFGLTTDATGIPGFVKFKMLLNTYVMYMSLSVGIGRIGTLTGGGYDYQVFTRGNTQYVGNMEWNADWLVWVFTATDGSVFYFRSTVNGIFLLDNTYVAETRGMFELSETVDVEVAATEEVPGTEDTPAVPAVPAHTAHVTRIEMTGMAVAYLHYTYDDKDMYIAGFYMQYANNGFAFGYLDEDTLAVEFRFRLMTYTDTETEEVRYVAEVANMDLFGTYTGDDLTVINLDGFRTAYYVDSYGIVYSGVFESKEVDGDTYVKITYLDLINYRVKYVYVKLDFENRTFVTVDASAYGEEEEENQDEAEGADEILLNFDHSQAYNIGNAVLSA